MAEKIARKVIVKKCEFCSKTFQAQRRDTRFCSRSCQLKLRYNKKVKKMEKRIIVKITNKYTSGVFYSEYKGRFDALCHLSDFTGYISDFKKEYYHSVTGEFQAKDWEKSGYEALEKQGNVKLSEGVAITVPEGLDKEALAALVWDQYEKFFPKYSRVEVLEIESGVKKPSTSPLELPLLKGFPIISDAGSIAIRSPEFEEFCVNISLKFGGDGTGYLALSDDLDFLNFEDYGFDVLVEKIKVSGIYSCDCPKIDDSYIEVDVEDYRIWTQEKEKVVVFEKIQKKGEKK